MRSAEIILDENILAQNILGTGQKKFAQLSPILNSNLLSHTLNSHDIMRKCLTFELLSSRTQ